MTLDERIADAIVTFDLEGTPWADATAQLLRECQERIWELERQ